MKKKRPDIVVFVAEDLDYEGINCFDANMTGYSGLRKTGDNEFPNVPRESRKLLTPTIDSLARDGVMFNNYYCVSAICTPARYSLLTGRYPERSPELCRFMPEGTQANIWFESGIDKNESNIAKSLQSEGYHTGIFGKWHNFPIDLDFSIKDLVYEGSQPDDDPNSPVVKEKIDKGYKMAVDHLKEGLGWDHADRIYFNNPEPIKPSILSSQNIDWIVEGAVDFIESHKDSETPLFTYIAVTLPHSRYNGQRFKNAHPLASPAGLLDKAPDIMPSRENIMERIHAAGLADSAAEGLWLDEGVNAVISALKRAGRAENTCFVFTTDHPSAGKGTCHLGRIPLIITWPGMIKAGQINSTLLSQTDLASTILGLAGCVTPGDMKQDGRSFENLLLPQNEKSMCDNSRYIKRDSVMLEVVNSRAVISGKWKYIANRLPREDNYTENDLKAVGWYARKTWLRENLQSHVRWDADKLFPSYFEKDQLYDIEADPLEQNNLAGIDKYQDILIAMKEKLGRELSGMPHIFGEFNACGQSAG